ncbi:condensin-2 complex subunit h2 [Plakobranchus ocellatus]|uniref:Condensin-2 complex subunit h2 n=1 Tax=Plakobranchus ocellatus TaxID=259542 RepID=A0AAV4A0A0_9GAST|nr:condensin-2 complex subunit h2 [Plakobranchus ocellatus]
MVLLSQTLGLSQGSLEERFSHLLQPIRDLARNWDVDIAHFLEEYLEDLEKIEITFNDGATTMNFSEAALLIQGSAGVYAKKVEYLYSLVYQVLDLITQKKKARSSENEGGEEDGETNDNEDDQFLPLDDIPDGDGSYFVEKDTSTTKSVRVIPEMPTRLIPLEESEKGDNILYNKKGEVMGNHCDFNIDTGFISTDGSILLELGDAVFLRPSTALTNAQVLEPCITEEPEGIEDLVPDTGIDNDDFDEVHGGDLCAENNGSPFQSKRFQDDSNTGEAIPTDSAAPPPQNVRRSQRKVTFARPVAKSKPPFKIPAGLEDMSTRKRRLKKEIKKELLPLHEVVAKVFSHRPKFPKNPLKVPEFPELEDAFWEEYKLREAIKKEEIKMLKKEEKDELNKEEQLEEEEDCQETPLDDGNDLGDDDDVDDIPQLQLDPDLFAQPGSMRRTTGSVDTGFQTGSCEDLTLSYEDLVQKYVESHETFDIHTYGTFVIEHCVRGEPIAFKDIVCGKKEFEICRYTLATLQLANVYNVELSLRPTESGNLMDCLYVTLLSTKRHFEDLEEYRAPSITNV